jgi:hypothetical protein
MRKFQRKKKYKISEFIANTLEALKQVEQHLKDDNQIVAYEDKKGVNP